MTTASPPRRRGKPYNPTKPVHDRRATDLVRNARVVAVEIDDPYEEGGKVVAFRSVREDPLADMLARKQITQCEFETGRHWQRAYENSEIGGLCGIDPSKEAVDGGRLREVLTDTQRKAMRELSDARNELGQTGNWIIIQILGTKKTIERVAWEWRQAKPGDARYRYVVRRFHEALETLSVLFGYSLPTRG